MTVLKAVHSLYFHDFSKYILSLDFIKHYDPFPCPLDLNTHTFYPGLSPARFTVRCNAFVILQD
uniref:Uncharacterized protein n=1 Tax=Anguilla anguilla TaxID=7936 RepID=A0A0E9X8E8_ANGAN